MMQMVIETYCAEIEGLKQKLEERDRKIAKLEYVNEKLHTLTDLQEANVNIMHENTMKLRKEIERLEKVQAELQEYNEKNYNEAKDLRRENVELQKQVEKLDLANYELEKQIADLKIEHKKQVDELKERAKIDLENEKNWGKIQTKQAVKDTAKEILTDIDDLTLCIIDGSNEFEKGYFQAITDMKTAIKDSIKEKYRVEVE